MSEHDNLLNSFINWMTEEKGFTEEVIFTMPTEDAFTYLHEYIGDKIKSDNS